MSLLSVTNLYIAPEVFRRELAWLREDPYLSRFASAGGRPDHRQPWQLSPAILAMVENAMPEMAGDGPGPAYAMRLGLVQCLLGAIAPAGPGDHQSTQAIRTHPAVIDAAKLLEDDVSSPWSLNDIAAAVHLSPGHLDTAVHRMPWRTTRRLPGSSARRTSGSPAH